jgi:glycosyltransferase involved in cell wall biosynthesis
MGTPDERKPGISAFFPVYNDGGTIASMVLTTLETLAALTDDYEVIAVQNGSTDYSADVLDELAGTYDRLRVLHFKEALGYGGALRVGFAAATKELIFYTDSDAQYDPRELALLLPRMRPGVDVVNGYKISRSDPVGRIIIGRVYHWTMKLMFGFKLRDVDCDFRLIRRAALERISLTSNTGMICLELVKKLQDAGCVFAEVPVHHYHRAYGKSQFFNFPRLWSTGLNILAYWWRINVSRRPLVAAPLARPERQLGLGAGAGADER